MAEVLVSRWESKAWFHSLIQAYPAGP